MYSQCFSPGFSLWPPCIADADIIFSSCGLFFFYLFFFFRLISAVGDWMSTHYGRGRPRPAPTSSTAFGRARGRKRPRSLYPNV